MDKNFQLYIREEEILKRTKELASQINKDFKGKDPIFVILLNGAFMFASDLLKNVNIPCQVCFIKASSYAGIESTGVVKHILGLEENINNRHCIVVDDIVDTGLTMKSVLKDLKDKDPASIHIAALLLKPEAFQKKIPLHYIGFEIPNNFVLGYGLDYNGYGRNLKDLYHLTIS